MTKQTDCNYANNYYGDKVCAEKVKPEAKQCNYSNNYYGDKVCTGNPVRSS